MEYIESDHFMTELATAINYAFPLWRESASADILYRFITEPDRYEVDT